MPQRDQCHRWKGSLACERENIIFRMFRLSEPSVRHALSQTSPRSHTYNSLQVRVLILMFTLLPFHHLVSNSSLISRLSFDSLATISDLAASTRSAQDRDPTMKLTPPFVSPPASPSTPTISPSNHYSSDTYHQSFVYAPLGIVPAPLVRSDICRALCLGHRRANLFLLCSLLFLTSFLLYS
jgi:hypothetical protein